MRKSEFIIWITTGQDKIWELPWANDIVIKHGREANDERVGEILRQTSVNSLGPQGDLLYCARLMWFKTKRGKVGGADQPY